MAFALPAVCAAATRWVSPTGTAAWGNCVGSTPLNGTAACSLGTANGNAAAGDLIYLRGGTYNLTGAGIAPVNSGTSATNRITYAAYNGETPILNGTGGYVHSIYLDSKSYVKIDGLSFGDANVWAYIINTAHHNEVVNCTFTSTTGGRIFYIGVIKPTSSAFATHNWIHSNRFVISGTGCTDGGADTLRIGSAQGAYGNSVDNDNYNTVEDNFFEHAQHANFDNYGMYNVFRNNIIHNEPWSSGCTTYTNPATYTNTSYNGKYGHRNFQITEDYNRTGTFVLVEGNRSGFAGVNQTNDGADGFSLAAPQNIVRYNAFFAAMNPGLMFKYYWSAGLNRGGRGGTYNRVYNNTFFSNGLGYPYGQSCQTSICPWPQSNISLYASSSGEGNVVKNNLMYLSTSYTSWSSDVMDKGTPANGWALLGSASSNWCTGAQASNGGCAKYGDPKFVNPDLSNPNSKTLPDLGLQSTSGAIDGGSYLTTSTNAGTNSTTLTVADALYFQDGAWGSDLARAAAGLGGTMQADWIAIGSPSNIVQIRSISYGSYDSPAGTITLASPKSWSNGASIWLYRKSDGGLVLSGSAPDFGAYEYVGTGPGTSVLPPSNVLTSVR